MTETFEFIMTETFEFITTKSITNEYSIPIEDLKALLEDFDLDYDTMSKDDIADFIADNEQEFLDYAQDDPEYSDTEVQVF